MVGGSLGIMIFLAAGTQPSTGTLRLGDLFTSPPSREPWRGTDLNFDPEGALVLQPDTSAWRLPPPEPTPTPVPEWTPPPGVNPPRDTLLPNPEFSFQQRIRQPAFELEGLEFTRAFPGESEVTISTEFSQLRVEYRLVSSDGDDEIVFLHAPGTEETFRVDAGRYSLQWRAWRQEAPLHEIRRSYPSQRVISNGMYSFSAPAGEEDEFLVDLRQSAQRQ